MSCAWSGLMQPISIFITPTSCAYDILDLPRHAKSPLSLWLPLAPILYLPLFSVFVSHSFSLSLLVLLSGSPPSPSPHVSGLKGHITLTPCVNSVSPSISLSGLKVRVNLLQSTWRGCVITSPGKGHPLSAQKWFCQHIQVSGEPWCNDLTLF